MSAGRIHRKRKVARTGTAVWARGRQARSCSWSASAATDGGTTKQTKNTPKNSSRNKRMPPYVVPVSTYRARSEVRTRGPSWGADGARRTCTRSSVRGSS